MLPTRRTVTKMTAKMNMLTRRTTTRMKPEMTVTRTFTRRTIIRMIIGGQ